jgi:integrase
VVAAAGLDPSAWTPRELRHSFVSLLSAHGVTVEQIADLVGHAGTTVTEAVYRHELRPMLLDGATVMDRIFPTGSGEAGGRDVA